MGALQKITYIHYQHYALRSIITLCCQITLIKKFCVETVVWNRISLKSDLPLVIFPSHRHTYAHKHTHTHKIPPKAPNLVYATH